MGIGYTITGEEEDDSGYQTVVDEGVVGVIGLYAIAKYVDEYSRLVLSVCSDQTGAWYPIDLTNFQVTE